MDLNDLCNLKGIESEANTHAQKQYILTTNHSTFYYIKWK